MNDVLLIALGCLVVIYFTAAVRYWWAGRRLVVWDYEAQRWRAAGAVMRDRHHR